jgi:hypothetical protein
MTKTGDLAQTSSGSRCKSNPSSNMEVQVVTQSSMDGSPSSGTSYLSLMFNLQSDSDQICLMDSQVQLLDHADKGQTINVNQITSVTPRGASRSLH